MDNIRKSETDAERNACQRIPLKYKEINKFLRKKCRETKQSWMSRNPITPTKTRHKNKDELT